MFATMAAGYGRFPRNSAAWPAAAERLPFIDRAVQDLPGAPRGTILFQRPHPNPIFQAEKLAWNSSGPPAFGAELKRRMREFFLETHTIEWESFSEFLPHDRCDVSLDPSVTDASRHPVARVRIAVQPDSLAVSDGMAARAKEVMSGAGAFRLSCTIRGWRLLAPAIPGPTDCGRAPSVTEIAMPLATQRTINRITKARNFQPDRSWCASLRRMFMDLL